LGSRAADTASTAPTSALARSSGRVLRRHDPTSPFPSTSPISARQELTQAAEAACFTDVAWPSDAVVVGGQQTMTALNGER